jgi:uncharacterized protein YjiS (DUF1127 family)
MPSALFVPEAAPAIGGGESDGDGAMIASMMTSGLCRILDTLQGWWELRRSRGQLARLSPYELRDIGICPSEAAFEAAKPFWRA